jgi:pyruvate decarboxylase
MTDKSVASLQTEVNRLRTELDSASQDSGEPIYVGEYLLKRLEQLGVTVCNPFRHLRTNSDLRAQQMFGVPGDFNLGFLDLVEDYPTIEWVGNW